MRAQLAPYLWHRVTGRPYVVAEVAATLDGVVAMADGTSQWITGEDGATRRARPARPEPGDPVGAGTVRSDDPALTARLDDIVLEPLRVVLGDAPADARVRPCLERSGDLGTRARRTGRARRPAAAGRRAARRPRASSSDEGLVNHVVWYQAPAFAGARRTLGALTRPVDADDRRASPGSGGRTCAQNRRRYTDRRGGLMALSTIEEAIAQLRSGGMVVVVDDEDRENEGDLIMAGRGRHAREHGLLPRAHVGRVLRARSSPARADELDLPLMVVANTEAQRTAFTVTVDYRHGTTTGISAQRPRGDGARADRPRDAAERPQPTRVTSSRCATARVAS